MATSKKRASKKKQSEAQINETGFMGAEIALIVFFLIALLLFLSNFGIIGTVGNWIKGIQLGFFGVIGYVFPIALFVAALFCLSNIGNRKVWLKVAAVILAIISIATIIAIFSESAGGSLGTFFYELLSGVVGDIGTALIMLVVLAISVIFITEKSIVSAIKSGSKKAYYSAKEEASVRKLEHTARAAERRQLRKEEALRKVSGIDFAATDLSTIEQKKSDSKDDYNDFEDEGKETGTIEIRKDDAFTTPQDTIKSSDPGTFIGKIAKPVEYFDENEPDEVPFDDIKVDTEAIYTATGRRIESDFEATQRIMAEKKANTELGQTKQEVEKHKKVTKLKPYRIPPMNLLTKGSRNSNFDDSEYKQTAITLQQTLNTFGIAVTVTDISCGPTVTRYELHPEIGVKVSRILALQDDLKLALAASSIRIEAPIPGKSAVGIEVPNKESNIVQLRDIFETKEFKESKARIAFAIGKDIGGAPIVTDLAKMPHMLIAGATGSGKSVCINTLILSILYKYSPDDVKMLMIDPKMVELPCYNGIPHLLIPVVTDVKKAAGALNWAVSEMEDRYKKFEAIGAKDIQSYNEKIEAARASLRFNGQDDEELPEKMPNIVVIVDELADLMMQCKGDVEPAIVRISQLARAAGMHLVIATQRPSVNVITGLIKANIPSRIALAVTSGVDSRTIIDTVGAEKLLGHGDMLFSPQSAPKPIRAQGAFISESDIHDVVNYILNQNIATSYDDTTFSKMMSSAQESQNPGGDGDDRDELFAQAGRYIIDKQKASIGNLQRAFRIGFNRAARIMDQLCDAGVVGPEQGTKPRDILMSEDEFEEIL